MPSIWFETKGDRSHHPLVLLHGFTGTHSTWERLAESLARKNYVIMPDLPGHGMTGVPGSQAQMGVSRTADAIAEVMRIECGKRKSALLGYSLGGRVALSLACRHPELLSCLILEGASPGIEREEEREKRRAEDRALADELESRGVEWFVDHWQENPLFASQKELPQKAFQDIRRDRLSNSARGLAMSLRAAGTGEMAPLWGEIGRLRMPLLLIVGRRDTKYAATADAMRKRVPGSLVVEVDGAGHCPHVERPEEFADLVGRFLAHPSAMVQAAK